MNAIVRVLVMAALLGGCERATPAPVWHTDVDKALVIAREQQAPGVMLDVQASWCGPCKELARAYETPVMQRALEGWVRVRVDVTESSDANDAFMERWNAGTPTVLFLDLDGRVLASVKQSMTPDQLAQQVPRRR